tara:strand:- start:206 stop:964 length:759 start_codon:yes stop_codon:yes gene_type:complete
MVDPKATVDEIVKLGYGQCGHIADVLSHLLTVNNIENRVVKLPHHIVTEAKWDDRWHLLDADLFKHGIIPNINGEIPSIRDVQGNYIMDRFMPSMYVYTREYEKYKDLDKKLLSNENGFYELHEAGFMSYYYQMNEGMKLEYPPSRPKKLDSFVIGNDVILNWNNSIDKDGDLRDYLVTIGKESRGWNYINPDYNNVPSDTKGETFMAWENKIELSFEKGTYYWSVKATDSHISKEPLTYYLPSEEHRFVVE